MGINCYKNLAVEYRCLPSCIGLYADISSNILEEIIDIDRVQKEHASDIFYEDITAEMTGKELMKFEYLAYKKSFGATFVLKTNGT